MFLFAILIVTLVLLAVVTVIAVSVGGAAFIVIFGDVIVCIVFIGLILKWLINRWR